MGKQIVWTDQAKADIRGIEQAIAIQVLKTLGRYVLSGEGATKQLKGITPPLIGLRAQNHRIFFRESCTTRTPGRSPAAPLKADGQAQAPTPHLDRRKRLSHLGFMAVRGPQGPLGQGGSLGPTKFADLHPMVQNL